MSSVLTNNQKNNQEDEDPLCKKYQYKEKIQWVGAKLFPWIDQDDKPWIRDRGQYNIVQVFADLQNTGIESMGDPASDKWECETTSDEYKNPENVCWNKDLKVVAALAEKGNAAGRHSEDFILRHRDVLHSKEEHRDHDAVRDLVIMSTNSPCEICIEKELLAKMCNGINENKPRFRNCYFLYSIDYGGSGQDWKTNLFMKSGGGITVVKCGPLPYPNSYQNSDYEPPKNALTFKAVKKDVKKEDTDTATNKDALHAEIKAEHNKRKSKEMSQKIHEVNKQSSKKNSNRFDRKGQKAAVEYFDMQTGDTSMDLEAFNEYHDLLYGNEYDYGRLQSAPVSPTLYPTYDEYLFTVIGLLFGIFAICLAMICSYIYGVITGVIGRNMIKERDVDVDLDLDV